MSASNPTPESSVEENQIPTSSSPAPTMPASNSTPETSVQDNQIPTLSSTPTMSASNSTPETSVQNNQIPTLSSPTPTMSASNPTPENSVQDNRIPTLSSPTPTMSASNPTPETSVQENQIPTLANGNPAHEKPLKNQPTLEGGEEEIGDDEEEAECGFCIFMKGGGCKEQFIAWEKCMEEAERNNEDVVDKCFEVTGLLKKCMDAHSDYYEPILRAEKVMEEEAVRELERVAPTSETQQ